MKRLCSPGDLFRMYSRYAQLQGWKIDLVKASSEGDVGGYKEIIANMLKATASIGRLKWESRACTGFSVCRRLKRKAAMHTSAASVAVSAGT